MRSVIMTVVIAVDYPVKRIFVLTALARVNQMYIFKQLKGMDLIMTFFIVFTCHNDGDCFKGFCHQGECQCSSNYEYAQDCSHYGCKSTL